MIISADIRLPFPRPLVYKTYRDNIVEIAPYLSHPNSIDLRSRREEGEKIYTVYEWHAEDEIPAIARAILSKEMLSWTEYNTWDSSNFTLDWRIKTHVFTESVRCGGKNCFFEKGEHTLIQTRGEFTIDPEQLKSVPFFLRNQIAHIFEDLIGKKIQPNLISMGEGVRRYLQLIINN